MSNPSKQKGTKWETDLVQLLRSPEYGEQAERTGQTGALDEGDLFVQDNGLYVLVEAKNTRQFTPATFVDQALVERANFCAARGVAEFNVMPLAIVKRRNKPARDAYVLTTFHEYFRSR